MNGMVRTALTLLDGFIDNAAVFPPAQVPDSLAWAQHVDLLASSNASVLRSLAWPAGRLKELAVLASEKPLKRSQSEPFPVSVIGSYKGSLPPHNSDSKALLEAKSDWDLAVETDVRAMNDFAEYGALGLALGAYESKFPHPQLFSRCFATLNEIGAVDPVVEFSAAQASEDSFGDILLELAEAGVGIAKYRTGGPTPESVPSSESLAQFILDCYQAEVPFKLTAGLHSAVRHFNATLGGTEHGFLNILAAVNGLLNSDLSQREIAQILTETDGPKLLAHLQPLNPETREYFTSIGSCSVIEPIETFNTLIAFDSISFASN